MKRIVSFLIYIVIIGVVTSGCSGTIPKEDTQKEKKASSTLFEASSLVDKNASFELTIMHTGYDEVSLKSQLKTIYPNATPKFIKAGVNSSDDILKALYSGSVPDLLLYDISQTSELNCIEGLENLLAPPYNAKQIWNLYPESQWQRGMSFDGTKLIAIPTKPNVAVTFYRADILEQCGIPADPEKLAELMKTSQGWLSVAKKLRENNKWMIQWNNDLIWLLDYNQRYFNRDMSLNFDKKLLNDILKASKEASKLGLESKISIWSEEGKKQIRDGRFALLYLGQWGEGTLNEWAPETSGKWRVTKLPLGINREWGATSISIPTKSKYKEQAWRFAEVIAQNDSKYFNADLNSESKFLGGQKATAMYSELSENLPTPFFTPLDNTVKDYWVRGMYSILGSDEDVDSSLKKMEKDINSMINDERKFINHR